MPDHSSHLSWRPDLKRALGILTRSQALATEDDAAEDSFEKGIDRLSGGGIVVHLVRRQSDLWRMASSSRSSRRCWRESRGAHDGLNIIGMHALAAARQTELRAPHLECFNVICDETRGRPLRTSLFGRLVFTQTTRRRPPEAP